MHAAVYESELKRVLENTDGVDGGQLLVSGHSLGRTCLAKTGLGFHATVALQWKKRLPPGAPYGANAEGGQAGRGDGPWAVSWVTCELQPYCKLSEMVTIDG